MVFESYIVLHVLPYQHSFISSQGCLPETEVFADIPDDPPIESKEQYIAESGNPLFPVFKIQNGDSDRCVAILIFSNEGMIDNLNEFK